MELETKIRKPILKALGELTYKGDDRRYSAFKSVLYDSANNALLACDSVNLAVIKLGDGEIDPWRMDKFAPCDPEMIKLICSKNKTTPADIRGIFTDYSVELPESIKYALRHTLKNKYRPLSSDVRQNIHVSSLGAAYKLIKAVSPYFKLELSTREALWWILYGNYHGTQVWFVSAAGIIRDEAN